MVVRPRSKTHILLWKVNAQRSMKTNSPGRRNRTFAAPHAEPDESNRIVAISIAVVVVVVVASVKISHCGEELCAALGDLNVASI